VNAAAPNQPAPLATWLLTATPTEGDPFQIQVSSERFTAGRLDNNQAQILSESVSRTHAEFIRLSDNSLLLRDLGSLNGVLVNGSQITEVELRLPCTFHLGSVACRLEALPIQSPASALPPQSQHPATIAAVHADARASDLHESRASDSTATPQDPTTNPRKQNRPWLQVAAVLILLLVGTGGIAIAKFAAHRPPTQPFATEPTSAEAATTQSPPIAAILAVSDRLNVTELALSTNSTQPEPEPARETQTTLPSTVPQDISATEERQDPATESIESPKLEDTTPAPPEKDSESAAPTFRPPPPSPPASASAVSAEPIAEKSAAPDQPQSPTPEPKKDSTPEPSATPATQTPSPEQPQSATPDPADTAPPKETPDSVEKPMLAFRSKDQSKDTTPHPVANGQEKARTAKPTKDLTVLILGDSLSLCGFGKRLDSRFRDTPEVKATYTYMACGTVPLSWLKVPGYANIRTCCGFWSIEQSAGKPISLQDTYGMRRGYRPGPHTVPKLEDLLTKLQPDILVMQTGTNLFGLFSDCKTVNPDRHDTMLRNYINPFTQKLLESHSSLRKVYWVAPPTSGRMGEAVQDFLLERARKYAGPAATVINSRTLISYPYTSMQPDKEHFMGADMDRWADKVFDQILHDVHSGDLPTTLTAEHTSESPQPLTQGIEKRKRTVALQARLTFKSTPLRTNQFLPYQESVVAYVYDVLKVIDGEYQDKQVLVMHPSHIRLQPQSLSKYRVGQTYELVLRDLDETPWGAIKASDQSGRAELLPFIQTVDDSKFPARGE